MLIVGYEAVTKGHKIKYKINVKNVRGASEDRVSVRPSLLNMSSFI